MNARLLAPAIAMVELDSSDDEARRAAPGVARRRDSPGEGTTTRT